ncbi:type II toxin-antitoxin system RelE family toxin [Kitasatospora sp. NPDC001132]
MPAGPGRCASRPGAGNDRYRPSPSGLLNRRARCPSDSTASRPASPASGSTASSTTRSKRARSARRRTASAPTPAPRRPPRPCASPTNATASGRTTRAGATSRRTTPSRPGPAASARSRPCVLVSQPDRRRLRVGDYRIVYTVDNGQLVVWVVHVGHCSTIYGP